MRNFSACTSLAFILVSCRAYQFHGTRTITGSNRVCGTSSDSSPPNTADDVEDFETQIDFEKLSEESARAAFNAPKSRPDKSDTSDRTSQLQAPRQAQWFPLLLSPPELDGTFPGDVGFDPFGFCRIGLDTNDAKAVLRRVRWMREAEVKHGRLAMLAAVGWPLSELWHKQIASTLGLESILASADRSPSILNGGMSNWWVLGTGAVAIGIGAVLELRAFSLAEKDGYKPGDLGFDPLRLHSLRSTFRLDPAADQALGVTREQQILRAKLDMELCETKHGRLAMLAVAGFVAQEAVTGLPVVLQTPLFFGDPIQ